MFTGIITARGEIVDIQSDGDWVFTIATPWDCQVIDIGASIACSGVCLVSNGPAGKCVGFRTEFERHGSHSWFCDRHSVVEVQHHPALFLCSSPDDHHVNLYRHCQPISEAG